MKNDKLTKQEIAYDVVQDLRDSVNKFLDEFDSKAKYISNFLTMDSLEELFKVLDSETRKTYLNMVSETYYFIRRDYLH